jgi:thiol-disulfide isomerase/thioredoxin
MDETKFLSEWKNKTGCKIEVVALDFEKITDEHTVKNNIGRLKQRYGINYSILFAGSNDKTVAANKLGLNTVIAYPTLIFLDKNKKVLYTHSGFSGPATGKEYEKFQNWFSRITGSMCSK